MNSSKKLYTSAKATVTLLSGADIIRTSFNGEEDDLTKKINQETEEN